MCGNWVAWQKLYSGDELLVCGKEPQHSYLKKLPKAFLYHNPSHFPSCYCHVPPQTKKCCARPRPWLSAFLAQGLLTLQKRGKGDANYTPDWRPESTLASPLTADALIQTGHDCCWSGRVEGVTNREWMMSSIVPDDSDTESWIWMSIIQERDVWMSLSMWRDARQCIGNFIRNCNLIRWLNQFVQTIFDLCRWKLCEWIKSNI